MRKIEYNGRQAYGGQMHRLDDKNLADIIGSSHVAGLYNFTGNDFLSEGADLILAMGSRVGKFWFTPTYERDYPVNHEWPDVCSMVELAKSAYFTQLFGKPFSTFILEAFPPDLDDCSCSQGLSDKAADYHRESMYEISKYLLETYSGTGKTFILQNWEMDWALTDPDFKKEPDPKTIDGIIAWLAARQEGVEKARKEANYENVQVAHAAEVNLVLRAIDGKVTAPNDILPHTNCDLYSYSSYDATVFHPERLSEALDYLCEKAPSSELYGEKNIYIGEYGAPENETEQFNLTKTTTETALDWGVKYLVYWQTYCNEPAGEYTGRPKNADCRGFWLVRPDGSKSPAYDYFKSLLEE